MIFFALMVSTVLPGCTVLALEPRGNLVFAADDGLATTTAKKTRGLAYGREFVAGEKMRHAVVNKKTYTLQPKWLTRMKKYPW